MQLQIQHTPDKTAEGHPLFEVVNMDVGKHSQKRVAITPPNEFAVDRYNSNLQRELRWYLERYLDLPIDTNRTRAEEIQKVLSRWGRSCFDALFDGGHAHNWYQNAKGEGFTTLRLKIASDDPAVLSWPWEALESGHDGLLAHQCRIERQLNDIGDVNPLDSALLKDQLNILYIIARPYGDKDVDFQKLARPLVDFVSEGGWPVHIDILRPPTFDRLRTVLEKAPNPYHIVHFDGHGGFGSLSGSGNHSGLQAMRDRYAAPSGALVFEKDNNEHSPELIPAVMLKELLRKHKIPVMILNACQSAMLDEKADDPFASVAASLLKGGIRSVVAMSYSLWVNGARAFVPEFYQKLFKDGDVAWSMQAGREGMYRNQMRDTFTGQVEFHDWVVPVLYQQDDNYLPKLDPGKKRQSRLPVEVQELGDYGFIGRDWSIQCLERAIRRNPAGILIHGMAGEGKTTLAKGFLQWMESTNGLGKGAFWFGFDDIHSAGYIINTLADGILETQAKSGTDEQKQADVIQALRDNPYFIVWDNFESAIGIPNTEVTALLPENDRKQLKQFLRDLKGGKTKVLITSRSPENWLTLQECYRLPLEGLKGEELWEYCNAVVSDLGLSLERESETYKKLMEKLEGNPLAVRVIMLRLNEVRLPKVLLAELEEGFNGLPGDEGSSRIQAALRVFERGLDREFAPILRLLGLHERYADMDLIGIMVEQTESEGKERLGNCFSALCSGGLCQPMGENLYKLHPALRSCLTRCYPPGEEDQRAFVDIMGTLADMCALKELHEQRPVFSRFGACFHRALELARELNMRIHVMALTQGMASYALHTRNFTETEKLYIRLAEEAKKDSDARGEASAYHQLGMGAQERRDFAAAEEWYSKSLVIFLKQGNEHGAASTYHQLRMVAEERRDFVAAEDWYNKSLEIELKQGNEHGAASTYHNLGIVAEERRDFTAAEEWHNKSLKIRLKQGNEHGAAITYHQLGRGAEERRDFAAAEDWYNKSLAIKLKQGNEYGAASTFHQLGNVAQKRQDYTAAEEWYNKALAIFDQNDPYYAEIARNNLISLQTMKGDDQQ